MTSPEREQAEALAERVEQWAQLNGGNLEWLVDDDDVRAVFEDALWCAHDLSRLAAAVSRLEVERDGLLRQRWSWENRADVSRRGHEAASARANEVRRDFEKSSRALVAAEAQVAALVGRERELTRALERIADTPMPTSTWSVAAVHEEMTGLAREALAGGGRTPTGQIGVADLIGLVPDMTGELSAEEHVRRLRDEQAGGTTHELKCWPGYFADVLTGSKPFEVRRDDRTPMFKPGDRLRLREWHQRDGYTGREVTKAVTYVLPGDEFGIEAGYCVMGLAALTTEPALQRANQAPVVGLAVLPEETP